MQQVFSGDNRTPHTSILSEVSPWLCTRTTMFRKTSASMIPEHRQHGFSNTFPYAPQPIVKPSNSFTIESSYKHNPSDSTVSRRQHQSHSCTFSLRRLRSQMGQDS